MVTFAVGCYLKITTVQIELTTQVRQNRKDDNNVKLYLHITTIQIELTTQERQNRKEINNVKVLPSDNNSPN